MTSQETQEQPVVTDEKSQAPEAGQWSIDPRYIEDGKILGKYSSTVELLEALAAPRTEVSAAPAAAAPLGSGDSGASQGTLGGLQVQAPVATTATTGIPQEDLARYEAEAVSQGQLSEASLAELEARGYPRELATSHVQGLLAQREIATQKVANSVGGMAVVKSALEWAGRNKSPEEISAINTALANSDATTQALIIKGLVKDSGVIGGVLSGVNSPALTSQPYPSQAQWLADLKKPEYANDPAFRNQVLARMKATEATGGFKNA